MNLTTKHQKVLAMAATKSGAPMDIHFTEARELEIAGLVRRGETFSVGGNRKVRWRLRSRAPVLS